MVKSSDFRQKEVINIHNGKRLGFVCDVDIDMQTGRLNSIIVPGSGRILGIFGNKEDYIIPWERIKTIGEDIILVDFNL